MLHNLATKQIVGFDSPIGTVVTRAVAMTGANAVYLTVVVKVLAHLGSPLFVIGLQTSNDSQNWITNVVDTISATAIGEFSKEITGIASAFARVTYLTNAETSALVEVDLETSKL